MWWRRDKKAKTSDAGSAAAESAARGAPRFLDPEVLARIGSLELLARAVVEGFIAGLHRSPFTGFSTEFTEYRQYNPGDDLRYLDWRLLGRTDRFFIKKYRADTNAQVTLLVDTSGSMNYAGRGGGVTKLQYAQFLAASLAHLAARQQDAVGLVAFGQEIHTHVPALNRTGHMRTVYGRLSALGAGGETRLAEALHATADRLTRRGEGCERRGEELRVLKLGDAALAPRVMHRPARVHQERDLRVRVGAVLLDEEAVGAPEQTPVEVAQIVARVVLPVLRELGREPRERRTVQPRDEALDHRPRQQLQRPYARQHLRV